MTPGWVRPCTCGKAARGVYCRPCAGFGEGFSGGIWEPPAPEVKQRVERIVEEDKEVLEALAPQDGGVPCKNGRYAARSAKDGEKVLPCGCPLTAAPRECVDAVATKTVDVKPDVGTGH